MPLPNRVDPFGNINTTPERGLFMGNRGCIHTPDRQLKARPWALKRWLICQTDFKGRKRTPMMPGQYTELFFLDEATALAAGHRPCAECRRAELRQFKEAWRRGNPNGVFTRQSLLPALDEVLHAERLDARGRQRTFRATLRQLPDGVMVCLLAEPSVAYLWHDHQLLRWSFGGYTAASSATVANQPVEVLTPPSVVRTLAAGYLPILHPSVRV